MTRILKTHLPLWVNLDYTSRIYHLKRRPLDPGKHGLGMQSLSLHTRVWFSLGASSSAVENQIRLFIYIFQELLSGKGEPYDVLVHVFLRCKPILRFNMILHVISGDIRLIS